VNYPVALSGASQYFCRNRVSKNGRISSQPEPDIRYIPSHWYYLIIRKDQNGHWWGRSFYSRWDNTACLLCAHTAEETCRCLLLGAGDKGELGNVARQSKQDGHKQLVTICLLGLFVSSECCL